MHANATLTPLTRAKMAAYHHDHGNTAWELFLDGSNLTGETARVHTSFLKDSVVLPDRNFSTGIRLFF